VSTASGADFYIAVPANTYASGFTVKVCDTEGHYMEKSKDASTALEAGHIHPMTAFEFVPTRTEVETIIITSAAELTTFATNWNSGAYSDADPFTVQLGNDITFTPEEAAAFPGIGTWEKGFSVTFDGQNHTISGYNASVPLFTRTESSSTVKDFTLNGTMSTKPSEAHAVSGADTFESYLGSVSGYHRGTISGVTSNVNIEINERTFEDPSTYLCIGGLVGKMVSSSLVSGSSYGGTISDASGFTGAARIYVGGIVGQQNNSSSTVSGCELLAGGSINLDATVSSSTVRYNVGGISGRLDPGSLSACTNNGTVEVSVNSGITGGTYTYVGGLCGANATESTFSDLSNNGAVIINIAGYAATQPLAVGGIIGSNTISLTGTENITNTSSSSVTVNGSAAWDSFSKGVDAGGIFGRNSATIDGLTNKGLVTYVDTDTDGTIIGKNLYLGGVIGVQTTGAISNCTNEGEVNFDVNRGVARAYDGIYYGGVVGYSTAAITVDHCSNSGYVHGGVNISGSTGASYVGGIAGYVQKASVVSYCSNTGAVTNRQYNTAKANSSSFIVPYVGGIVGGGQGTSDERITIINCGIPSSSLRINGRRGAAGGIVGYLQYGDVSNCTFESHINNQTASGSIPDYNSLAFYIGGICGISSHANISGCTVSNANLSSTNVYYIGGILALGYHGTVIDDCHFLGGSIATSTNVQNDGGIGAITGFVQKSGTDKGTIKNCTFKGTLAGSPMTEPGAEGTSVSGTTTGIGIGNGHLDNNHLAN